MYMIASFKMQTWSFGYNNSDITSQWLSRSLLCPGVPWCVIVWRTGILSKYECELGRNGFVREFELIEIGVWPKRLQNASHQQIGMNFQRYMALMKELMTFSSISSLCKQNSARRWNLLPIPNISLKRKFNSTMGTVGPH